MPLLPAPRRVHASWLAMFRAFWAGKNASVAGSSRYRSARPDRPLSRTAGSAGFSAEQLENRLALAASTPVVTVPTPPPAAPSVWMTAATDTGLRDEITSLTRPAFAGKSAPGTVVRVEGAGGLIGVATTSRSGNWSLATPANKAFAPGQQLIRVTAVAKGSVPSEATPYGFRIDNAAPTATLSYDDVTGRAVLQFSRPVSGVSAATLRLSGRTASGINFSASLADPRLAAFFGQVTVTASEDRTLYTFTPTRVLAEKGSYTLTAATTPKIVDSVVGNAYKTPVSVRFTM